MRAPPLLAGQTTSYGHIHRILELVRPLRLSSALKPLPLARQLTPCPPVSALVPYASRPFFPVDCPFSPACFSQTLGIKATAAQRKDALVDLILNHDYQKEDEHEHAPVNTDDDDDDQVPAPSCVSTASLPSIHQLTSLKWLTVLSGLSLFSSTPRPLPVSAEQSPPPPPPATRGKGKGRSVAASTNAGSRSTRTKATNEVAEHEMIEMEDEVLMVEEPQPRAEGQSCEPPDSLLRCAFSS